MHGLNGSAVVYTPSDDSVAISFEGLQLKQLGNLLRLIEGLNAEQYPVNIEDVFAKFIDFYRARIPLTATMINRDYEVRILQIQDVELRDAIVRDVKAVLGDMAKISVSSELPTSRLGREAIAHAQSSVWPGVPDLIQGRRGDNFVSGRGRPYASSTVDHPTHDLDGEALKGPVRLALDSERAGKDSDDDSGRWRSPRAGTTVTTVEVNPHRP